jgi:plasmid stabilization system protein ParE
MPSARWIGLRAVLCKFADFPLLGGKVPEYQADDVRQVQVIERPYRIIYRVRSARVDILAIVHGAQLLSPEP